MLPAISRVLMGEKPGWVCFAFGIPTALTHHAYVYIYALPLQSLAWGQPPACALPVPGVSPGSACAKQLVEGWGLVLGQGFSC